jgi:hypothetical protein
VGGPRRRNFFWRKEGSKLQKWGRRRKKKKKTEGAKLLGNELEEENRIERRKQGIA